MCKNKWNAVFPNKFIFRTIDLNLCATNFGIHPTFDYRNPVRISSMIKKSVRCLTAVLLTNNEDLHRRLWWFMMQKIWIQVCPLSKVDRFQMIIFWTLLHKSWNLEFERCIQSKNIDMMGCSPKIEQILFIKITHYSAFFLIKWKLYKLWQKFLRRCIVPHGKQLASTQFC